MSSYPLRRLFQVAFINGRIMEFALDVEAAEGCSPVHPVNQAAQVGACGHATACDGFHMFWLY